MFDENNNQIITDRNHSSNKNMNQNGNDDVISSSENLDYNIFKSDGHIDDNIRNIDSKKNILEQSGDSGSDGSGGSHFNDEEFNINHLEENEITVESHHHHHHHHYKGEEHFKTNSGYKKRKKRQSFDILLLKRIFKIIKFSTLNYENEDETSTPSFLNRLFQRMVTYWNSFIVFLLLLGCIGEILLGNEVGKQNGAFSKAIVDGYEDHYSYESGMNLLFVCVVTSLWIIFICFVKTIRQFLEESLCVSWRNRLTRNLQYFYLKQNIYYDLNILDNRVDNPDQRITSDIDNCTKLIGQVLTKFFSSPLTVIYYTFTYRTLGWQGPAACYVMFVLGFTLNKILISPLIALWFKQERLEGNFRFSQVTVRTNAESIAFYGGQEREREINSSYLTTVISNRWKIIIRNILLNFHMNMYGYVGGFLNFFIIAFAIYVTKSFAKESDTPGMIVQRIQVSAFESIQLIYGFTQFIQLGSDFSELAGYASRLGDMFEVIKDIEDSKKSDETNQKSDMTSEIGNTRVDSSEMTNCIEFRNVSVFTPFAKPERSARKLVSNLSFRIERNHHTLIMGPSGCGKTSILRILGDLWPFTSGHISKPKASSIFYVPQQSYTNIGSLRDQITYPAVKKKRLTQQDPSEDIMIEASLKKAKLAYLLFRTSSIDVECNWTDILSPGEKQRLSFARLFYQFAKRRHPTSMNEHTSPSGPVLHAFNSRNKYSDEKKLGGTTTSYSVPGVVECSEAINQSSFNPSETSSLITRCEKDTEQLIKIKADGEEGGLEVYEDRIEYVILDESTSALDVDVEHKIYETLKQYGVTIISVGHRPTLKKYHQYLLLLDGKGNWEYTLIHHKNG